MKVVINGFGRIGRTILRQALNGPRDVEICGINDIATLDMLTYLFRYDSTFGPYPGQVTRDENALVIDGHIIPVTQTKDIKSLDLTGVDVVLECTGIARTSDVARRGLEAGAGRVLISGPSPAAELTVVLGANDADLVDQRVVSNASCTTNGVAPLLRLLDETFGLSSAHMTTIHCYTNSQPLVDAPRGDLARSRAAALSMVPTTSSAVNLIDTVVPGLKGRVTGSAVRVPTASVSAIDLTAVLDTDFDAGAFRAAVARCPVLGWTEDPVVSTDLRGRPESLVLAGSEIRNAHAHVRIFGWYDNEWGFAARMLDVAQAMTERSRSTDPR